MTGGGSVFTTDGERVTHGFEIHCDLREPNNIEVNWAPKNNFHLTELTGALCTDSPAIDQNPPNAPFGDSGAAAAARLAAGRFDHAE